MSSVTFRTQDNGSTALDSETVESLRSNLSGISLVSGDEGYDESRLIWNKSFDCSPGLIAFCKGVADVIECVNFARDKGIELAIRCGGHNVAGTAITDGGIVIDLTAMNNVRVDTATGRVRAGGGANIGEVDRETQAFGLAVPLGVVSKTGIAGLTLNGGHSWLTRKHGFACDNLISVDLVTADGNYITASETENPDLFWAIRGGGGNFGVITSFEYQAHPVGPEIAFTAVFYPVETGADVFGSWRDYVSDAPDKFTSQFVFWSVPHHEAFPEELHGRGVGISAGLYCGDVEEGLDFIKPLQNLGEPLLDLSGPLPYIQAQQSFDPFFTAKHDRFNYWKSLYLGELTDSAVNQIAQRAANRPNPWALISTRLMGGAASRIKPESSCLGGRQSPFMLSIDTAWTDPADSAAGTQWTREFWDEMNENEEGAAYLNFVSREEDSERLMRESFGEDVYNRLAEIKTRFDPTNLFRLNQNIKPA